MVAGDQINKAAIVQELRARDHVTFSHASRRQIGPENKDAAVLRRVFQKLGERACLMGADYAILDHQQRIAGQEMVQRADEGGSFEGRLVDRMQRGHVASLRFQKFNKTSCCAKILVKSDRLTMQIAGFSAKSSPS